MYTLQLYALSGQLHLLVHHTRNALVFNLRIWARSEDTVLHLTHDCQSLNALLHAERDL